MKLYYSATSPFVRKVMITAIERGLEPSIERLACAPHPVRRDATLVHENPLGQAPTLILNDGTALSDSRVICEYLDSLGAGGKIFPTGPRRWRALTEQSMADGLLDAALNVRYEYGVRAEGMRSEEWIAGQMAKVHSTLRVLDDLIVTSGALVDIGTITIACALGYLDLRYADLDWKSNHPHLATWHETFARRKSYGATAPVAA